MFDKDTYTVIKRIGHGLTSECFTTSNPNIVVKVIKQSYLETDEKNKTKLLLREIAIHKRLIHPNIVKFIYHTWDDSSHHIILEKCNGNLRNFKETYSITLPIIKSIMRQLLKAVSYLHVIGIYHRDIKLENIFYKLYDNQDSTNPIIKLGDFGSANYVTVKSNGLVGTPRYMAPEIVKNEHYTNTVDIWSCGVVMFILLVGLHAWKMKNVEETYKFILNLDTDLLWEYTEDDMKNSGNTNLYYLLDLKSLEVLKRMITYAHNRLPASELLKLNWFSKTD